MYMAPIDTKAAMPIVHPAEKGSMVIGLIAAVVIIPFAIVRLAVHFAVRDILRLGSGLRELGAIVVETRR